MQKISQQCHYHLPMGDKGYLLLVRSLHLMQAFELPIVITFYELIESLGYP